MVNASTLLNFEEKKAIGRVTCRIGADEYEILSLDSLFEGRGIGCALVESAQKAALRRLWLIGNFGIPIHHEIELEMLPLNG